jgi:multidrug efflux pump subunit AcrA (membrane-fusion protein)
MLRLSTQRIDKVIKHEDLYSLRKLETPSAGILLAKWLMVLGLVFVIFLFLPWQQNIRGSGAVTALSPEHRPQTVQAIIAGQIQQWHVNEGDYVSAGDTIVTIREVKEKYFDPQLLTRLEEQLSAKRNSLM